VTANKSCPGIFVTGTDTGVGKTIVTAALARHFTAKGLKVGVMKPIETGVANTQALGADASLLRWSCNATDPDEIIAPYRYEKPLAPCQAASAANELNMPLLIITHPRLGTLNHTLLTTFAARAMELEISGYLINQMPENPGEAEKQAPHLLSSLASADLLGVLPEVEGSDQDKVIALADEIDKLPAYQWLLNAFGVML